MWIDHVSEICPFRGWFFLYTKWPVTRRMHEHYESQPWPEMTNETIKVSSLWPDEDEHTTSTPGQDVLAGPQHDPTDVLDVVWQDLEGKDSN